MIQINWPETLRALRDQENMTQTELAEQLGCNQPRISYWENGENVPSPAYRRLIKKMFNLPPVSS